MTNADALDTISSHQMAAVQQIAPVDCERSVVFRATAVIADPLLREMKTIVGDTGRDMVLFCYDATSVDPKLVDILLLMPVTDPHAIARGEDLILVTGGRLWAPVDGGSMMIVAKDWNCHFVVPLDGARLERRHGLPADALGAGLRRARRRIAKAMQAKSAEPNESVSQSLAAA